MKMKCLAQGHNTAFQVRFEPVTLRSRVRHSTNSANGAPLMLCGRVLMRRLKTVYPPTNTVCGVIKHTQQQQQTNKHTHSLYHLFIVHSPLFYLFVKLSSLRIKTNTYSEILDIESIYTWHIVYSVAQHEIPSTSKILFLLLPVKVKNQ